MGRDLHYVPGSFYRVDDRTGFATRADRTRQQWDNQIVDERVWEPRQPQDLVRGVRDDQSVPLPRPDSPAVFVGPTDIPLAAAAVVGQTVLQVQGIGGFGQGQRVGVMLDSGVLFNTTLAAPPGNGTLTLANPLPGSAASGNLVYNYTENISVAGVTP